MMKQKTKMYSDPDPHTSRPSFENDSEPALPALPQPDKALSPENRRREVEGRLVRVTVPHVTLEGNLEIPEGAVGIVLFAHGSGSGRRSPRNRYVAHILRQGGFGRFRLMTVGGWLFMRRGGRKLEQKAGHTESPKLRRSFAGPWK